MVFSVELVGLLVSVLILYRVGQIAPLSSLLLRKFVSIAKDDFCRVQIFFSVPSWNVSDPILKLLKPNHTIILKLNDVRIRRILPAFPVFTEFEMFLIILGALIFYSSFIIITWSTGHSPAYIGVVYSVLISCLIGLCTAPFKAAIQHPMRSHASMLTILFSLVIASVIGIILVASTASHVRSAFALGDHLDVEIRDVSIRVSNVLGISSLKDSYDFLIRLMIGASIVIYGLILVRSTKVEATLLEIVQGAPTTRGSDIPHFSRQISQAMPRDINLPLIILLLGFATYLPPVAELIALIFGTDQYPEFMPKDNVWRVLAIIRSACFILFAIARLRHIPILVQAFIYRSATPYAEIAKATATLQTPQILPSQALEDGRQFLTSTTKVTQLQTAEMAQRSVLLRAMDACTAPAIILCFAILNLIVAMYAPGDGIVWHSLKTTANLSISSHWGEHWSSTEVISDWSNRPFTQMLNGNQIPLVGLTGNADDDVGKILKDVSAGSSRWGMIASDGFSLFWNPRIALAAGETELFAILIMYIVCLSFHHAMTRANLKEGADLGSVGSVSYRLSEE